MIQDNANQIQECLSPVSNWLSASWAKIDNLSATGQAKRLVSTYLSERQRSRISERLLKRSNNRKDQVMNTHSRQSVENSWLAIVRRTTAGFLSIFGLGVAIVLGSIAALLPAMLITPTALGAALSATIFAVAALGAEVFWQRVWGEEYLNGRSTGGWAGLAAILFAVALLSAIAALAERL